MPTARDFILIQFHIAFYFWMMHFLWLWNVSHFFTNNLWKIRKHRDLLSTSIRYDRYIFIVFGLAAFKCRNGRPFFEIKPRKLLQKVLSNVRVWDIFHENWPINKDGVWPKCRSGHWRIFLFFSSGRFTTCPIPFFWAYCLLCLLCCCFKELALTLNK